MLNKELRPIYSICLKHDALLGSLNFMTPLLYHTSTHKLIYPIKGENIRIKMASWKYAKYLHEIKDFENLEHRLPINV